MNDAREEVASHTDTSISAARRSRPGFAATRRFRIVFSSPRAAHLEPALAHGGDPVFLDALFGELRARGHDIRIASRVNVRDFRKGRARVRRFLTEARVIRAEMKQFAPDAWIVYNPSPTHPDLFGWWLASGRYVVLSAETWLSRRLKRHWRWLFTFAFRQCLRRADKVGVARPAEARRLRMFGVVDNRVEIALPGVPVPPSIPSQAEAREHVGFRADEFVVLAVSRFTADEESKERKTEAIVNLVSAFRSLPLHARLVVVGDGPGRPRIEKAIRELRLSSRTLLPGAVAPDDLTWWMAACDVYAFPDLLDRPRLSMLDAQACGRPVITLRTESAELTVSSGRTGVLASDLAEFEAELVALAGDRARCEAMGREARAYVARRHSIDVRARQIEEWLAADH